MEVRQATTKDADEIREVARQSLEASYSHFLDEDAIGNAVEEWYGTGAFEAVMNRDSSVVLVVEEDDRVVGFTQADLVGGDQAVGEVLWIHVAPEYRGRNLGTALLEGVESELVDRGVVRLRGLVLAENEIGNEFYENRGFRRAGEHKANVGGEEHVERVWEREPQSEGSVEVTVEEVQLPEGDAGYVMYAEVQRGAEAPFFKVFRDEAGEDHYGWYCDNCESLDVAADTMGSLQCNNCGNRSKPARWDAAYL